MNGGDHHSDRVYLLHCWQEGSGEPDGEDRWRFSIEEVLHKRWRRGFTSVDALVDFLKAELAPSERVVSDQKE